jgi:hypothetical protein
MKYYLLWTLIGLLVKSTSASYVSYDKYSIFSTDSILLLATSNETRLGNLVSMSFKDVRPISCRLKSSKYFIS